MMKTSKTFAVGHHRPVYLWAGPGTIRMNRLKFMDAPVDEPVHHEAHTLTGATRNSREAHCNWAYLTYNWGFPPEIEQEDWEAFRQAVPVYHSAGIQVFGYIQTSNYVVSGSFADKDWYAQDPKGRPFYYYTGRYMACWQHPDWRDHLRKIVWDVVHAEADGVFFDNPWHGTQPQFLGGTWIGSAGCYCPRCRSAFREATGLEIPALLDPEHDEHSRSYLRWRADQVTATLAGLADYARSLNPEILISANDFDAVMRPSFVTYGIDLAGLSQVQDVMMIEDYGLPQWQAATEKQPARLVNNALTIRTARALIGETPLSVDPYDKGIGFDQVYPARRFQQAIAEAAACGASMVIKGTEFVEPDGTFTLLTAETYAPQRAAIGTLHRWLREHAGLYHERENLARIGLLAPGETLWQRWGTVAPLFFGAGQTLLAAGQPWRVVTTGEDLAGLDVLLHVTPLPADLQVPDHVRLISVPELPGWEPPAPSYLARHRRARVLAAHFLAGVFRAYFRYRWARILIDRTGLTEQHFMQSELYAIPPRTQNEALLHAVGAQRFPRLETESPVLISHWRQGKTRQLHLVNYADAPQTITLTFAETVKGKLLVPESDAQPFQGETLELSLDTYAVILI